MDTNIMELYMAASGDAASGAESFMNSTFGQAIINFGGAIGVIVVIIGLLKSIGQFLNGRVGGGFKIIGITILIAGILFSISLLPSLISWASTWIGKAIDFLKTL